MSISRFNRATEGGTKQPGYGLIIFYILCFFVSGFCSVQARAESSDNLIDFDIPRQSADKALNIFAQQAQIQLLFPYDTVKQYVANKLKGRYSPKPALEILLRDTGLKAEFSENGHLTIKTDDQYTGDQKMYKKKGLLSMLSAMLFSAALTTHSVSAQTGAASGNNVLEEVTVTARKIEENLQDTPIAITAFSGDTLEARQIFNTETLDQVTPNLQFTNNTTLAGNNASSVVFIRGIGQTDPTSTVDPGVGIYIDDVYMGQSIGGTMDFRDIGNVQVLRGPQGTLFGKNTVGGAIVLTSKEPGDEFGGTFRVGYGSDNLRDAFIAVDVPVTDELKSRFSFGTRLQDGYVHRVQTGEDLGDTNTYTFTGKAIWTPNDQFKAKVAFDYTHSDENGNPFVFATNDPTKTFQIIASRDAGCPGVAFPPPTPVPTNLKLPNKCANTLSQYKGPYANNGTYPLLSLLTNWGVSFHLDYDYSDEITFKSITSYRELDWRGIRDADNTPLTILHTNYNSTGYQFSQELQLLYERDQFHGVAGFYYFEDESDDIVYVQLNTPAPGVQEDSDNNIANTDDWAVFFQGTYDFNEKLSLTFGGRYTEDTKGSIPDQFNYAAPTLKYLPVKLYEDTFTAFTISSSISYRWNEDFMTYFSYSEGFKGGGWNSHFNTCQIIPSPCFDGLPPATATPDRANATTAAAVFPLVHSFGPEYADTFEIGFKSDLLDNTLRLNGAFFTTDYTDLQFTYRAGVAPYLANAGKASIDGFELEATWVPATNWMITGGVGYLDTSIDSLKAIAGIGTGVVVGNVLPFSPEWQANAGISYTANLENGWLLIPRADFSYNDRTYFDANNTMEIAQLDSATVVNLSAALEPANGKWRLTGGINNATDELYPTGGNSSLTTSSGYAEIAYARPREFFISFSYNF